MDEEACLSPSQAFGLLQGLMAANHLRIPTRRFEQARGRAPATRVGNIVGQADVVVSVIVSSLSLISAPPVECSA